MHKKVQDQLQKPHPFFKKQNSFEPIQFKRSARQSNPETVQTVFPNNDIKLNFMKVDRI